MSIGFARCIARILCDGNLYYRYVRYSNKCTNLIMQFILDIQSEFGNITITKGITNTGTPFVQINRKFIIEKFLKYHPNYKSLQVFVPKEIMNAGRSVKKVFVRAVFDDEGCAGIRVFRKTGEWKRNIDISSTSKKFLLQIKEILEEFSIKSSVIVSHKTKNLGYRITITGKDNISHFNRNIGSDHPDKKEKLNLMVESYGNTFKRNREGFMEIYRKLKEL